MTVSTVSQLRKELEDLLNNEKVLRHFDFTNLQNEIIGEEERKELIKSILSSNEEVIKSYIDILGKVTYVPSYPTSRFGTGFKCLKDKIKGIGKDYYPIEFGVYPKVNERFYIFNILANRFLKEPEKWLCGKCILRCIRNTVGSSSFDELTEFINNLRRDFFIRISEKSGIECVNEPEAHKKFKHYRMEYIPDVIAFSGQESINTKKRRKRILDFFDNIECINLRELNVNKLEIDHKIPRATMNRDEVEAHNEILTMLDDYSADDIKSFWENPEIISIKKKLYVQINLIKDLELAKFNGQSLSKINEKTDLKVNKKELVCFGLFNYFQLLTKRNNLRKKDDCLLCQRPDKKYGKKIRAFPYGIEHFYDKGGNLFFEEEPKEKQKPHRCVGCFWYCPKTWLASLDIKMYPKKYEENLAWVKYYDKVYKPYAY